MDKGWISIHRGLKNHWLYNEKRVFSKLEAWLDILLEVNHTEKKVLIKSVLFNVKRGESINSLDTWATRWNWNKSKVRRFLKTLENDLMIELKNEHKTTRLTVCKYDSYQDTRNANETELKHRRNGVETELTPNNNDNNDNNVNNINNIYEKFVDEVKNHNFDSKIEILYMHLKLRKGTLQTLLEEFRGVLIKNDRLHKTTQELFKNFDNWLNVQDRLGKLDKHKRNKQNAL